MEEKIELVEEYIKLCDEKQFYREEEVEQLVNEICSVFINEIHSIYTGLLYIEHGTGTPNDDLKVLRSKLMNYKVNLSAEKEKLEQELEVLKLKQSVIKLENNNTNANNNTNEVKSSLQANMNVELINVLNSINDIPESTLSDLDKLEIINLVSSMEVSQDTETKKEKIIKLIKYIADKGFEVGIALIPYIYKVMTQMN